MNIHVARTPHFRTRFTHTCCQGQTGSLTVRPDTARCGPLSILFYSDVGLMLDTIYKADLLLPICQRQDVKYVNHLSAKHN